MSQRNGHHQTTSHERNPELFHSAESAKDKMSEADPNLERSMTVQQGTEKMFTQYYKLYEEKKAGIVQTTLYNFFL